MSAETPLPPGSIRVKMVFRGGTEKTTEEMLRRFPRGEPVWGACRFIFDRDARDYDWFAVYDDLPARAGERFSTAFEPLACSRARTLLVTTEPSPIKLYGAGFLSQFGHVLTSQEPWVIRHPGAIFSQPALVWFYGRGGPHGVYDRMVASPPEPKTAGISTVCSAKRQTHTLHHARYDFVQKLRVLLPELEVFGHGVRPIADKAEALDAYRYHVAIENHVCRHHWTEKLSDAFLGLCLPFYHGCPNAADYFPAESFIPISLDDPAAAARLMRDAIRGGEYERRLPAIREARRLVLERYGLFSTLSDIVSRRHAALAAVSAETDGVVLSRRAWRGSRPSRGIAYALESAVYAARRRFPSLRPD